MTTPDDPHRVDVARADALPAAEGEAGTMPVNLYTTPNYVVVDVGVPRCRAEHVRVTLAGEALRIEAERHPGDRATEAGRMYAMQEMPAGPLRRDVPLPAADLALHEAEATFANGMLTVTIPTRERDAHRHEVRGEEPPERALP